MTAKTADPLETGRAKLAAHEPERLTEAELAALKAVAQRRSADEILAIDDQETEDVYVPQWDTVVTIRSLTGMERDKYEASLVSYDRNERGQPQVKSMEFDNLRARLVALVAIDTKGTRLFTSQQHVLALGEKNANALDLLFQAAQRVSKLGDVAIAEAKDELVKVPNDSTGSASPVSLG